MKKIFIVALVLIAGILVLGFTSPKEQHVERSMIVHKPVAEVFTEVLSFKNRLDWSPWLELDPTTKHTFTGTDGEVGAIHAWESTHKQVGIGEQELTNITFNKEIVQELRFKEPFKSTSTAYFRFDEVDNGTKVSWGFNNTYGFVESIFMRFIDLDTAIGDLFTKGLSNLKQKLEA